MVGMMDSHVQELDGLISDLREQQQAVVRRAIVIAKAIDLGGYDLSPCGDCGEVIVCIPDGLPMCERCAKK